MCRELRSLGQSIAAYVGSFDAQALTLGQAGEVVRLCARIEASAASIKALAAARSAEGGDWKLDGYRSAADQLAHATGMSPAAAKRALEAGRLMAGQPDVAAAATAGELSFEQPTAVADGVAANPDKARELIDRAQRSSLPELNEQVALVKAARTDPEQHRKTLQTKRSLRRWTDREGALHAHLYGHPEDGAGVWRMLDPIRRRLNMLRRQSGSPHETLDALDYDALMTMAAIALGTDSEVSFADLRDLGLFPQAHSRPADKPDDPPGRAAYHPNLFSAADSADPGQAESSAPPPSPPPARAKKLAGSPIRLMIRVDLDDGPALRLPARTRTHHLRKKVGMSDSTKHPWPWPAELDAMTAAPEHHTLLFENEHVRVLDAHVNAGDVVPVHTHCWPGVLYILGVSDFVRRDPEGSVVLDTRSVTV